MMKRIILKCKTCKGTGQIQNPNFEECKGTDTEGQCKTCKSECHDGEMIDCWACYGQGELEFDEKHWEFGPIEIILDDKQENP